MEGEREREGERGCHKQLLGLKMMSIMNSRCVTRNIINQ